MANTSKDIIDAICSALDCLGIRHRLTWSKRREEHYRDVWEVAISRRDDLERLLVAVPLQDGEKRRRLNAIVTSYAWAKPPDEAELRRLYLDEGLSVYAIAKRLGRSHMAVYDWLQRAGVTMRPRGPQPKVRK